MGATAQQTPGLRELLRRRWWLVLLGLILLLLLFATRLATFYTDYLWFASLDYTQVFTTVLVTRLGLGFVTGLVTAALIAGNLLLAQRLAPAYRLPTAGELVVERYRQALVPFARPLLVALSLFIGFVTGASMVGQWRSYLLWANAVPFGRLDPQFGRDIGYFVFVLPFHTLVNSWLFSSLILVIGLTAGAHYLFGGIRPQAPAQRITPQANVHLSILLAALVAVRAWGFRLDQFMLSYSERGQVTGLTYTDANAELVALQLLTVIAAFCVILFLANIRLRVWQLPTLAVGILLVASVVLSGIFPAIIQRVQVAPQELERERPFIQRNLDLTRFAYGLDDVEVSEFPAEGQLTPDQVVSNDTTLQSVRLWDPGTSQSAYQQLQELRPYYDFTDVDTDRYEIGGEQRQVMISVREISEVDLPPIAQTWTNRALVYTHGYGQVASEVSSATAQGRPVFLASDLPPQGAPELLVENPRIYFGETPPEYSIVDTGQRELDFPSGTGTQTFVYDGADGVDVGSPGRRLAFALRYGEPNFLLSGLLTDRSKVLFQRNIRDRVAQVAPFLQLDGDPYPVAADGRIQWVLDAYTTSDMVPYSERVDLGALTQSGQLDIVPVQGPNGQVVFQQRSVARPNIEGRANYIRNSVKAVVDAYDGTVRLYKVDAGDPVLRAWEQAFPGKLEDLSAASPALRGHFRYPEDIFRVQSAIYGAYHIPGPDAFYTREDAWQLPADPAPQAESAPTQSTASSATAARSLLRQSYQLLRLPGEPDPEFALLQPFTPVERTNLIALLAGRGDPERYGQLRAYRMPPTQIVLGPEQIQALVNQDPDVAPFITLANQQGSRVIYGNLLTVPIEDSLLYVQPLFVRAEQSQIPELRNVVVVFGDAVAMQPTLFAALEQIFGAAPPPTGAPGAPAPQPGGPRAGQPAPPTGSPDAQVRSLVSQALQRFADAEAALRTGDLGAYQEQTRQAQQALAAAQRLLGGGGASPTGTAPAGGAPAGNAPAGGAPPRPPGAPPPRPAGAPPPATP